MSYKLIGYIAAIVIILALGAGLFIKLMQKSEGYKAQQQYFYTHEPHLWFGCSNYLVDKEKREAKQK